MKKYLVKICMEGEYEGKVIVETNTKYENNLEPHEVHNSELGRCLYAVADTPEEACKAIRNKIKDDIEQLQLLEDTITFASKHPDLLHVTMKEQLYGK